MNRFVALSLFLGASALTVPRSSCSFGLTASGGESGTIGQLSDGQNRIGGGLSPGTFTIDNGGIIDAAGRGCILTPSIEQFQCDQGVGPTYGFAIDSNGTLTSCGSSIFYACPASDTEWNLYTTPVMGQKKCVEISLIVSGCGAATSAVRSVTTVTVYDCGLSSSASALATSPPAVIATSAPVVQSSTPATTPESSPSVGSSSVAVESSTSVPVVPTISVTVIPPIETTTSVYSHTYVTSARMTSVETPSTSSVIMKSTSIPIILSTSPVVTPPLSASTSAPIWANTTFATSTVIPTSSIVTSVQSSSSYVATALTGSSTSGNYQYPHLIVPISSSSPDTAAGTSYFGTISSNTSTIFNFDIPFLYSGSTCSLIFLLPLQSELETSSYTFSGTGGIDFEQLSSPATTATTWDHAPSVSEDLGEFTITEGSSTLIESFACPAGETVAYELSAVGNAYLYYFQDWNPSPLGLYITVC